jgi:hypothetical protein
MEAVAIDDRWALDSNAEVIERHLSDETAYGRGDLSDGHEPSDVEHFRAREHEDGPSLATHPRQPNLAAPH